MEESSERRRERLRAMREEASWSTNEEERPQSCVATPPDPAALPLPHDIQQPAPSSPSPSPSPRFEFYTDPLAAFSGSQRKKKPKNSLGSPLGVVSGSPAPSPCKSPPSPFWQPNVNPDLCPPGNFNSPGRRNVNANLPPAGGYSTPAGGYSTPGSSNYSHSHSPKTKPNPNFGTGRFFPGSFNTPYSNPSHSNPNHSDPVISNFTRSFTPPGSFITPGSAESNPMVTPQAGFSNHGPSMYGQQPLSASQMHISASSGGPSLNTPAQYQYNQGHSLSFSDLSPQNRTGSVNNHHHSGWSQGGMSSSWSQGSNRSRGSFVQSPGSNGRDNRTPGRSGGRGFHRNQNEPSAVTNPELFVKQSMLVDPWKDLLPVRIESVAFRLNSCSVAGSQDWLPKSANKGMEPLNPKGVTVTPSGPSLAESLAASFADAVAGEDAS